MEKRSDKEDKEAKARKSQEDQDNNLDEGADERSESDLTEEDMEALGEKDLSMDLGEDEQLKHRTHPVDFGASELDVPGAELDDDNEEIGSEDEENNSWSIGGDDHEDLEEDSSTKY